MNQLHNKSSTPEYTAWCSMKTRCYNPNYQYYEHYGARGIEVADEWINDFRAFYNHVGPRPSAKHSLDRIDNNGNYEPGNVRWATDSQQKLNRGKQKNNTTGTRNVYHISTRKSMPYRVDATVNQKRVLVGYFHTEKEALAGKKGFMKALDAVIEALPAPYEDKKLELENRMLRKVKSILEAAKEDK